MFFDLETSLVGLKILYEIIPFDTHSTANLPPLAILKKNQVFKKTHPFFFQKIFK